MSGRKEQLHTFHNNIVCVSLCNDSVFVWCIYLYLYIAMHCIDFKSEILHIHLDKLQPKAFSASLIIEEPISLSS